MVYTRIKFLRTLRVILIGLANIGCRIIVGPRRGRNVLPFPIALVTGMTATVHCTAGPTNETQILRGFRGPA